MTINVNTSYMTFSPIMMNTIPKISQKWPDKIFQELFVPQRGKKISSQSKFCCEDNPKDTKDQ